MTLHYTRLLIGLRFAFTFLSPANSGWVPVSGEG